VSHLRRGEQINHLLVQLRQKKWTVGFGESCTGGLLSGAVARVSGVSDVYMGSVVTYSYQAKVDLLGVSLQTLNEVGAVSEEVARQMVRGVCLKLKVHCGIAITGIAGPTGGSAEKPVGTVWVAVAGPGFEKAMKRVFTGDRAGIQDQSVDWALDLLREELKKVENAGH